MKTNLLLPIAGNGQRFIDAGYKLPKPLIEINGKTILDRSLESVNIDNCNLIFIIREDHVKEHNLNLVLRSKYKDCKIVIIPGLTEGALCTCLLAEELIDNDNPLMIFTPDCYFEPQIDPKKFKVWYKQNGTPKVKFKRFWDQTDEKLTIQASQSNPIKKNPYNDLPLIIPINLAIFCGENKTIEKTVVLKTKKQEFIFRNVRSNLQIPLVTYFREFSSPVEWESDTTLDEKYLILKYEKDFFTLSNTVKVFYKKIILCRLDEKPDHKIENKLISTLISFIQNKDINLSLLSELLSIPTFAEIESEMKNIDPLKIYKTIDELNHLFGIKLKEELYIKLQEIEKNLDKVWPEGKNERKLIETIWKLLLHGNDEEIKCKIINYVDSNSMTLAKAALNSFSRINCPERKIISNIFFNKWKNNSVVLDSWFSFNASIEIDEKTNSIEKLFENKFFDSKSPNTLRAILNTFVTRNNTFHAMDGSGYKYIAKKIIEFDKLNPIVISRFVKVFSRYNYYSEPYKSNMIETIKQIKKNKLSKNTKEVLDAIIN